MQRLTRVIVHYFDGPGNIQAWDYQIREPDNRLEVVPCASGAVSIFEIAPPPNEIPGANRAAPARYFRGHWGREKLLGVQENNPMLPEALEGELQDPEEHPAGSEQESK